MWIETRPDLKKKKNYLFRSTPNVDAISGTWFPQTRLATPSAEKTTPRIIMYKFAMRAS